MQLIHYFVALLASLFLAMLLDAGPIGYLFCLMAGAFSAYIAERLKGGSERVYWIGSIGTILLITVSNYGANFHRIVIILPLIILCGYFLARLTLRFRNQKPN